jgi:hypothetical protein
MNQYREIKLGTTRIRHLAIPISRHPRDQSQMEPNQGYVMDMEQSKIYG